MTDGIPINEPSISLVKECSASSNMAPADIMYTYTVENTGDSDPARPIDLAMGEEDTVEYILLDMPEGTYTNTATSTGFDEGGHEVTARSYRTTRGET